MAYKAFISYSHSADGKLAPTLQSALERFAKPWWKPRAFRVFRDTTNLSLAPELWPVIEKALSESEYFLYLASPDAAKSKWVAKEQLYWRENKDTSRLLIILTSGEIAWDDHANDFDWERTDAVPGVLGEVFRTVPLYLDFRKLRSARLSMDNEVFLDHIATIAAPLHDTSKDQIFGEHIRQHRKTMRIAWGASAMLAVLFVVAAVAALLAVGQYQKATSNLRIAEGRRLAASAQSVLRGHWLKGSRHNLSVQELTAEDPIQQAALLARDALQTHSTTEAKTVLEEAIGYLPMALPSIEIGVRTTSSVLSPFGPWLAAFEPPGKIFMFDVEKGVRRYEFSNPSPITFVEFNPTGSSLGVVSGNHITVQSSAMGELEREIETISRVTAFAFGDNGNFFAAGCEDGRLLVWRRGVAQPVLERSQPGSVLDIALGGQNSNPTVATAGADDRARVWSNERDGYGAERWVEKPRVLDHTGKLLGVALSADGDRALTVTQQTTGVQYDIEESVTKVTVPEGKLPHLWDCETGAEIKLEPYRFASTEAVFGRMQPKFVRSMLDGTRDGSEAPPGPWVMGGGLYPNLIFWSSKDGRLVKTLGTNDYWPISEKAVLSVDNRLLFTAIDEKVNFASVEHNSYYRIENMPAKVDDLLLNDDGILVARADGSLKAWRHDLAEKYLIEPGIWLVGQRGTAIDADTHSLACVNQRTGAVEVWDIETRRPAAILKHETPQSSVKLFDPRRGILLSEAIDSTGRDYAHRQRELTAWDLSRQTPVVRLTWADLGSHRVSGPFLLLEGKTEVSVVDLRRMEEFARLPRGGAKNFRIEGRFLVGSLEEKRELCIWGTEDWKRPSWLESEEAVKFIAPGVPSSVVTRSGPRWRVRDASSGVVRGISDKWSSDVVGLSRDRSVVVGSRGNQVQVWSVSTGRVTTLKEGMPRGKQGPLFAVSPDNRFLINGRSLWQIAGEIAGAQNRGVLDTSYHAERSLFSPDGRWLVIEERDEHDNRDDDLAVELWDTASWKKQTWFQAGGRSLASFVEGGRYLQLDSGLKSQQVWDLARCKVLVSDSGKGPSRPVHYHGELPSEDVEELLQRAGKHLRRELTPSERSRFYPDVN